MDRSNQLYHFFKERLARMAIASIGLFIYSFGYYLQLLIGIGTSPWHALNQGLSQLFGITFGQVSILVSLGVVAFDLLMKEPIGIGTILDSFLVGLGTDFFLSLDLVPYQEDILPSLALLFISIVIVSIGSRIYIGAGLSCGPRDAMAVAIGKRVSRLSIGTVLILLNVIVGVMGWLLGGSIGWGTVVNVIAFGIITDAVFSILHFEPRDVEQEGLSQTLERFLYARKNSL